MFFRRKKLEISREEALAAKPLVAVDAKILRDESGSIKLLVPLKSPRWASWFFRLPEGSTKTFELDEIGAMVWECCNGKNSVQQIIRKLAGQYNLNLREAEVATIKFLQTLTRKGLIGLSVRKERSQGEATREQGS